MDELIAVQTGGPKPRNGAKALHGLLFLAGAMYAVELAGGFMSSPWTVHTAAGDDEFKKQAAKQYLWLQAGTGVVVASIASLVSGNVWPLVGMGVMEAELMGVYYRAMKKAEDNPEGWGYRA